MPTNYAWVEIFRELLVLQCLPSCVFLSKVQNLRDNKFHGTSAFKEVFHPSLYHMKDTLTSFAEGQKIKPAMSEDEESLFSDSSDEKEEGEGEEDGVGNSEIEGEEEDEEDFEEKDEEEDDVKEDGEKDGVEDDGEKDDSLEDEAYDGEEGTSCIKSTSSDNRISRLCVLCGKRVLYMSHHLARQHKVVAKDRRMRLLYQSRAIDPIKRSKIPQYNRKPRDCHFPGCYAKRLARLDNHLVSVHKLKRGSPVFSSLLCKSRLKKFSEVQEKQQTKKELNGRNSVFDRAGQHLLLLAGGGASAQKTVQNHVLQMKKISEMAGGIKDLFTNSSRLRRCSLVQLSITLV